MDFENFPQKQKLVFENERKLVIANAINHLDEREKELESQFPPAPKKILWLCLGAGLLFGIFGVFPGYLLGTYLDDKREKQYKEQMKEWKSEAKTKAKAEYDQRIEEINIEYAKKYDEYVRLFELEAQNESVRYAESTLAKEVINWMTEGFIKVIDSADRRPHIQEIDIPFIFKVYTDKITCNLGEYDFEINRCRSLETPIEQTSLARAIASSIQLNLIMKYPVDQSGTPVKVNIECEYKQHTEYKNGDTLIREFPEIKMNYIAHNGDYRAVESW